MARPAKRSRIVPKKSAPGKLSISEFTYTKGGVAYSAWRVQGWREEGKWQRRQFRTRPEAEAFVATKQIELLNGSAIHTVATKLRPEQVAEAEAAINRLGDRYTLDEAVTFFLSRYAAPENPTPLPDAIRAFALGKEAEGIRPRTLRQLDSTLGQFRRFAEGRGINHVHEVGSRDVERFLKGIRAKGGVERASRKTWNNYRADLSSFFGWCADPRRRWVAVNPIEGVAKLKLEGEGLPEVLSIKAALRLMRDVEAFKGGRLIRFFALGLFAGLRPGPDGELFKLARHPDREKLIDLRRGVIHVPAEISKTRQKRQVAIRPNLRHWLETAPAEILPANFDRDVKAIRKAHGLAHDVLRHTFITAHVAAFRSVGDAALEAGNSEAVVKKHYLNLTTRAEGEAFWRIAPRGVRLRKAERTENPFRVVA